MVKCKKVKTIDPNGKRFQVSFFFHWPLWGYNNYKKRNNTTWTYIYDWVLWLGWLRIARWSTKKIYG